MCGYLSQQGIKLIVAVVVQHNVMEQYRSVSRQRAYWLKRSKALHSQRKRDVAISAVMRAGGCFCVDDDDAARLRLSFYMYFSLLLLYLPLYSATMPSSLWMPRPLPSRKLCAWECRKVWP